MKAAKLGVVSPMQFSLALFDVVDEPKAADEARKQCSALPLASATTVFRAEVANAQIERIKSAAAALEATEFTVAPSDAGVTHDTPSETLSDDPSSPYYRFRDTGEYIAGSRKEAAASAINRARKDGQRVHFSAIDWDDLEKNPREAKALICKSALFGIVDWAALRDAGMTPAAGFLVDRVYAAIAQEPSESHRQARQDYAIGLQTLRDRLEASRTPEDVVKVLDALKTEYDGHVLTPAEVEEYEASIVSRDEAHVEKRALDAKRSALYNVEQEARHAFQATEWAIKKRSDRGWAPKPELAAQLAEQKAEHAKVEAEWSAVLRSTETRLKELTTLMTASWERMAAIQAEARARNKLENPLHRAWMLMGPRFMAVLYHRYDGKGSQAFRNYVATAKHGKIQDWGWAEKEVIRAPRLTEESVRFHFKVAEKFDRVGGREIEAASTEQLKSTFGLSAVQSGKWVLRDTVSGKFHSEKSATAFADLADLLGIDDSRIGLAGRLGLAFGARGRGAAGWKGGAPAAHYEPRYRVINLTKINGGGALGHEHWHAIDNLIVELVSGKEAGEADFASARPDLLPEGELRDAMEALRRAMLDGSHRAPQMFAYSSGDYATAKRNVTDASNPGTIAFTIKAAGNVHSAVQAIDSKLGPKPGVAQRKRDKSNYESWRRIAIAYYGANPAGGEVEVLCGPTMSSYALEAKKLDGPGKPYYRLDYELSARAFQCWIEDRLAEQDRLNQYLSVYADNKYCVCPITGYPWKPYPEGEERQRINAAFDRVVAALRAPLSA